MPHHPARGVLLLLPRAGEWHNNVKEGRGVYRFPRGGVYEGEWRGGVQEGLGVRTWASGKVQVSGLAGGRGRVVGARGRSDGRLVAVTHCCW